MKNSVRIFCAFLASTSLFVWGGCKKNEDDSIKLTIWVSEADGPFAKSVVDEFKAKHPEKNYNFIVDVQGVNDVATRVLNDVENAADIYEFSNDQLSKLVNGDALTRIAGERLQRVSKANSKDSMESATITLAGETGTYGMPYTDNTFFLYYNKGVLTETDVQTLDGILSKCTDKKQFAYPIPDGWYTTAFYFGKGLGYEVSYDENLAETSISCDFDNSSGIAVTTSIWEYVKDNRLKADANDSKITAGFNDGSIIAAVSGIWNKTTIEKYLGENFAATKLPTYTLSKGLENEEQVQLTAFAGYKLMGVSNYSKNKTDALDFAEFYTNKENQIKHFEARGYVPTDEEARKDDRVQKDICAQAITKQLQYSKTQRGVPSTMWLPMEGLGTAMITGKQSGNFDVTAQLKACVEAIKKTTK